MGRLRRDWVVIWDHPWEGSVILCQDGMWRKTPDYGTYRECAKQYTSANRALNAVKRLTGEFHAKKLDDIPE